MERITLCGSTKFKKEFEHINRHLSLNGNIVYSVAIFGHFDKFELTVEQKIKLDNVHIEKINNSDGIFVINVDGYIGESTKREIAHAEKTGKFVRYLTDFPELLTQCEKI